MQRAARMSLLSWVSYGASFALVISLIFLLRFVVRYLEPRLTRRNTTRSLQIVEALPLDPKRRLVVFSCRGREGLLLTGLNGDSFIGWLEGDCGSNDGLVQANPEPASGFSQYLSVERSS